MKNFFVLQERDELQLKVELLERQMEEMAGRETELQKLADQARALKDEVQWKSFIYYPEMRPWRGLNGYHSLP